MFGVLVEIPPTGRVNIEAVRFDRFPNEIGRFEIMRPDFETDNLLNQFERQMRRRYERVAPNFEPFLPSKTPDIEKVIFNDPATIVIWKDKTKTVVKCQEGDTYSPELGLAMCISKKYLGNKGNFNEVFKKWIPESGGRGDN